MCVVGGVVDIEVSSVLVRSAVLLPHPPKVSDNRIAVSNAAM